MSQFNPTRTPTRSPRGRTFAVVLVAAGSMLAPVALVWADCWSPPVAAPVVDPFREPMCRWCPGNRGIEYGTRAGDPVRAVASGEVTFAGSVAGTEYLVVRHANGLRVTYGNLSERRYGSGDTVTRGAIVGTAAGRFHLGLRDGDTYIDPAPFIGELRGVVRLIPADGSAAPPAPPARLVCNAQDGGSR